MRKVGDLNGVAGLDPRRSLSRRRVVQGAAALAAGVTAAGAGLRSTSAQSDPVELTYWHGWTDQWEEMVQYVCDMFHAKQDRIRIKPQVVSGDELLTKLTAAIAAGNPPDVVTLFGSTAIPTLASEDAIIALDTIEGVDMAAISSWMDANVLELGRYQGGLYGLSYWAGCYALICNSAHLTEAGLDPATGPADVASLDSMAEALTKVQDGGDIDRLGFKPDNDTAWLWGTAFGGSFYDATNNKITANDPKIVEAMTWYQSYAEKYGPENIAAFTDGLASERAQNLDPLLNGNYSMQLQGPWKLGDIKNFGDGFEYIVVPPPVASTATGPANWIWGDIQVIPKGSKDPAAAAEFVQFTAGVNDAEGYAKRVTWGDRPINIPVSSSVLSVPSFQQVVANFPGFQTFIDSLFKANTVGSPPVMPAAAYYSDRFDATVDSLMLLESEPQAALDDLTADVQKEIDRASA